MSNEAKILGGIAFATVVILVAAVFILGKGAADPNAPVNQSVLIRSDSHKIASDSAKVTLVEFGDFECPYCGEYYPNIEKVLQDDQGKVNFVFRNFPLPQHTHAQIAAEAAEAAGEQGKYWEMVNKLYTNQNDWANAADPLSNFVSYAKSIGINSDTFKTEVQQNKFQSKIDADVTDGTALHVDHTPTLYIDGVAYNDTPTYDNLKSALQKEIDAKNK